MQHTPEERGGLFEEVLLELGWGLEILPLFPGTDLPPSLNGFGLTLAMDGPMSANQEKNHPFLKKEIRLLIFDNVKVIDNKFTKMYNYFLKPEKLFL